MQIVQSSSEAGEDVSSDLTVATVAYSGNKYVVSEIIILLQVEPFHVNMSL